MTSTRVLLAVAFGFACLLAVSTGATIVTEETDERDQLDEDLVAYPHPGPNGVYAHLEGGEMVLDLTAENPDLEGDGVPAGAETGIDDVFVLENDGDEPLEVFLESDQKHIEYYTTEGAIDVEEGAVALEENETVSVGVAVDTTGLEAGDEITDVFDVESRVAESESTGSGSDDWSLPEVGIEVSDTDDGDGQDTELTVRASTSPIDTLAGDLELDVGAGETEPPAVVLEALEIDATEFTTTEFTVAPTDGAATSELGTLEEETGSVPVGGYVIEDAPGEGVVDRLEYTFTVDRTVLDGQDPESVALYRHGGDGWEPIETTLEDDGGESLRYVATLEEFSTYAVGLEESAASSTDPGEPATSATEIDLEPETLVVGEPATVSITVVNDGFRAGTFTEEVTVDDDVLETLEVDLDAGESKTVALEWTPAAEGDRTLSVGSDGAETGSVAVDADGGDDGTADGGDDGTADGGDDGTADGGDDGTADGGDDGTAGTDEAVTGPGGDEIEEPAGLLSVEGGVLLALLSASLATLWLVRLRSRSSDGGSTLDGAS